MLMEYDISGSTTARYTMGLGIDEPISVKTQNATGYYHSDGLGTIREITSSTGAVLNAYNYDAWGNIQSSSETIAQPFTFTAREWDSDAGLYYYRARYMDARVGRFTAVDPICFLIADMDATLLQSDYRITAHQFYGYTYNNPATYTDPHGEFVIAGIYITAAGAAKVAASAAIGVGVYYSVKCGEWLKKLGKKVEQLHRAYPCESGKRWKLMKQTTEWQKSVEYCGEAATRAFIAPISGVSR